MPQLNSCSGYARRGRNHRCGRHRCHCLPLSVNILPRAWPQKAPKAYLHCRLDCSSGTVSGDRCIPRRFNRKHIAPNSQFPLPGGLYMRDKSMSGKSTSRNRSQALNGIYNFLEATASRKPRRLTHENIPLSFLLRNCKKTE